MSEQASQLTENQVVVAPQKDEGEGAAAQQEAENAAAAEALLDHVEAVLQQVDALVTAQNFADARNRLQALRKHFLTEARLLNAEVFVTTLKTRYDASDAVFKSLTAVVNEKLKEAPTTAPETQAEGAKEAATPAVDATTIEAVDNNTPATGGEVIEHVVTGAPSAASVIETTVEAPVAGQNDDGVLEVGTDDGTVGTTEESASPTGRPTAAVTDGAPTPAAQPVEASVADVINPEAPSVAATPDVTAQAPAAAEQLTPEQQRAQQREAIQRRAQEHIAEVLIRADAAFHNIPIERRQALRQEMLTEMMARVDALQAANQDINPGVERMNIMASILGILNEAHLIPTRDRDDRTFRTMMNDTMDSFYGADTLRVGEVYTNGNMQYKGGPMIEWLRATQLEQRANPAAAAEAQPTGEQQNRRQRRLGERLFGWFGRNRNVAPANEFLPAVSPVQATEAPAATAQPAASTEAAPTDAPTTETPAVSSEAVAPTVTPREAPTEAAPAAATDAITTETPAVETDEATPELTTEELAAAAASLSVNRTDEAERPDDAPPPPEAPAPAAMLARLHGMESGLLGMTTDEIEGINPEQLTMVGEAAELLHDLREAEGFTPTVEDTQFMDAITDAIQAAFDHQLAHLRMERTHSYDQRAELVAALIGTVAPALFEILAEDESGAALEAFTGTIIVTTLGRPEPAAVQSAKRAEWRRTLSESRRKKYDSEAKTKKDKKKEETKKAIVHGIEVTIEAVSEAVAAVSTLNITAQRELERLSADFEAQVDEIVAQVDSALNAVGDIGDRFLAQALVMPTEYTARARQFVRVDIGVAVENTYDRVTTNVTERIVEWWRKSKERAETAKQKREAIRTARLKKYQASVAAAKEHAENDSNIRGLARKLRDR